MRAPPASLLAMLVILAVLGSLWPGTRVTPLSSYDQRFYLGIAYDLRHSGRFTDGFAYAGGGARTARPSGMRFTPLYPAVLAALASIDPRLRQGMECVEHTQGRTPACPRAAPVARAAQFAMLAGFYWLLWWSVTQAVVQAGGSARLGWIGLGLALLTAPTLLRFVNTLMTEMLSLLLSTAACALAVAACEPGRARRRAARLWACCGLVLGLAVLSRPAFMALVWAAAAFGGLLAWRRRAASIAMATAAMLAGAAVATLPWVLRNLLVLHRAALTFGYASHTLIQRIAFDAMTPREYGLSFACWLPHGEALGRLIGGRRACDRFGWDDHPESFYAIGNGALMRDSLAAAGGWPNHMGYILRHYVLAHPLAHALVTIPLALRGLGVAHEWGLLLAPVSLWAMRRALRRGHAGILLLSVPAWFLLLVNASLAVNQPRYNFPLILPFSLAGALLIDLLWHGSRPGPGPTKGNPA